MYHHHHVKMKLKNYQQYLPKFLSFNQVMMASLTLIVLQLFQGLSRGS